MESLKQILKFLLEIRLDLESSQALSYSLKRNVIYQKTNFSKKVYLLLKEFESGVVKEDFSCGNLTSEERVALNLICRGLQGDSILKPLGLVCEELEQKIIRESYKRVKKMPYLSLVPLLLFQWPSILFLFLFPLIQSFLKEFL